jgi:hypothetical protein
MFPACFPGHPLLSGKYQKVAKISRNRAKHVSAKKKGLKPKFKPLKNGAGERDRTVTTSLEG